MFAGAVRETFMHLARVWALTFVCLAGCGEPATDAVPDTPPVASTAHAGNVDDQRIMASVVREPGSWLSYGQDYREQRFSRLTQITRENVNNLNLAWHKVIGGTTERMQGTPLVVDGVMYATNGWNVVFALDAASGAEIWRYDPQTNREYVKYSCCGGAVNRGVAVYEGRVFVATNDGRLIAVDAATGAPVWDVDTYHESALGRFNITGAPRTAGGKVFIGNGSSEVGRRRGYVTAYDTDSGELAWRFYLVPGDPSQPFEHPEMEMAAKTWGGEWWKLGGGGTAWNSLVFDEAFNTLLIGVGNGAPWPRQIRSPGGGDDLFLTAIVAVDIDTGRMRWYYQTVPGDNWDYSAAMDITLADMEIDGVQRKVMLQAPKNGFFYVIDRDDGELLRAHRYTDQINWATHVDLNTGRPVENPEVQYELDPQWIIPANAGAHNWEPMSFDENAGIMYLYYHDYANFYSLDEQFVDTGVFEIAEVGQSLGIGIGPYRQRLAEKAGPRPPEVGYLGAFDPLTGEYKWRHRLESSFNGGVLATATGVLFHGEGQGIFRARSTEDGEPLWAYDAAGAFSSSVISYAIGDTQYVATMVSGSLEHATPGTLLVFKLGGTDQRPLPPKRDMSIPEQPPLNASAEELERGNALYHRHCALCHRGLGVESVVATVTPDLRRMSAETRSAFAAIVLGGARQQLGMPSFAGDLDHQALNDILQFVTSEAIKARAAQQNSSEPNRS